MSVEEVRQYSSGVTLELAFTVLGCFASRVITSFREGRKDHEQQRKADISMDLRAEGSPEPSKSLQAMG